MRFGGGQPSAERVNSQMRGEMRDFPWVPGKLCTSAD